MKVLLAAINAKYIHSNLALRYLSRFQDNDKKHHIITREFTINQRPDFIVEELFRLQPDVILFSAYIWNVETLRQLCPLLKKIMPHCIIGFGGPEVSYESEIFLQLKVLSMNFTCGTFASRNFCRSGKTFSRGTNRTPCSTEDRQ